MPASSRGPQADGKPDPPRLIRARVLRGDLAGSYELVVIVMTIILLNSNRIPKILDAIRALSDVL
jgi:hypothetical protein